MVSVREARSATGPCGLGFDAADPVACLRGTWREYVVELDEREQTLALLSTRHPDRSVHLKG